MYDNIKWIKKKNNGKLYIQWSSFNILKILTVWSKEGYQSQDGYL